jgi:hypothetical protein
MNSVDKATQTQLDNIQLKTGKSLDELFAVIKKSGLVKHAEIRDMLRQKYELGYGDANALGLAYKKASEEPKSGVTDVLDEIYAGQNPDLRAIHERLIAEISKFGEFEIAPKKGYVSLRRKKQFATVGPASKQRVEVGMNMKGLSPGDRLLELPAGGMCQYKVYLSSVDDVDGELLSWILHAFESAG